MRTGDTIAALATGPGRSRRAILRISGPLTAPILSRICADAPTGAGAHTVRIRLPSFGDTVDLPALLLLWRAPRSYTGEDAAELFIPGNPALIARVLALILDHPADDDAPGVARAAGPGEFTARAFLAGKLSLDQAEGVQALIAARSDEQLAAARALLAGISGAAGIAMADQLAHALALVEAGIDFTDQEDVVPIGAADLRARLERIGADIRSALGPAAQEDDSGAEPLVALVGAPNAGKSTLFNALLERERVLVSDTPGTTRDAICESLALPGAGWGVASVGLVDLAGLDEALGARSVVDAAAQRAALGAIAGADVLVFCDPSGRFENAEPFATIDQRARPVIRVRTKADLPGAAHFGASAIEVCALDGFNLGALRRAIADAASQGASAAPRAGVLLPRRRRALTLAREAIDRALDTLGGQRGGDALRNPELVAAAMRDGLDQLAELTGAISPDDIIGRVFATFCVGK